MASGNTRLNTWISTDVDERLRLQALVSRQKLSQLLTDLLDDALPAAAALTAQLDGRRSRLRVSSLQGEPTRAGRIHLPGDPRRAHEPRQATGGARHDAH